MIARNHGADAEVARAGGVFAAGEYFAQMATGGAAHRLDDRTMAFVVAAAMAYQQRERPAEYAA